MKANLEMICIMELEHIIFTMEEDMKDYLKMEFMMDMEYFILLQDLNMKVIKDCLSTTILIISYKALLFLKKIFFMTFMNKINLFFIIILIIGILINY